MPLKIHIKGKLLFDQKTQQFVNVKNEREYRLEHSLISISKWEEITKRKFLSKQEGPHNAEDVLLYIDCMSLDGPIPEAMLRSVDVKTIKEVLAYINDNKTATTFSSLSSNGNDSSGKVYTSEMLYYYIGALNLPSNSDKWHLSRLLAMIRYANLEQERAMNGGKPKNVPFNKKFDKYHAINEARKARLHTSG